MAISECKVSDEFTGPITVVPYPGFPVTVTLLALLLGCTEAGFSLFRNVEGEARDFCDWEAHKKEWAQGFSLAGGDLLDPTLGIHPKGSCGADGVE